MTKDLMDLYDNTIIRWSTGSLAEQVCTANDRSSSTSSSHAAAGSDMTIQSARARARRTVRALNILKMASLLPGNGDKADSIIASLTLDLESTAAVNQPLIPAAIVEGTRHCTQLEPWAVGAPAACDHLR